jgi:hypothetical protein
LFHYTYVLYSRLILVTRREIGRADKIYYINVGS